MGMTFDEYERAAARTFAPRTFSDGDTPALAMGGLGIAGEAGEVADEIKKHLYHGKPLDRAAMCAELGDVLWYVAFLANRLGYTLSEVAEMNDKKLQDRYPHGFVRGAR